MDGMAIKNCPFNVSMFGLFHDRVTILISNKSVILRIEPNLPDGYSTFHLALLFLTPACNTTTPILFYETADLSSIIKFSFFRRVHVLRSIRYLIRCFIFSHDVSYLV